MRSYLFRPAPLALASAWCAGAALMAAAAGHVTGQAPAGAGRGGAPPSAQAQPAPAGTADEANAVIASARASRAAGRGGEAFNTVAAFLKKYPANVDAARFQIDMFLQDQRFDDGLRTYDASAAARQKPDAAMLAPLARFDLKRTVRLKVDQPKLEAQALERLASDGDADALRTLKQLSAVHSAISPDDLAPTVSLARLKDPAGEQKLASMANARPWQERAQVFQAAGQAGVRSLTPQLIAGLHDPEPNVVVAAEIALGLIQAKEAVPDLQKAFKSDIGIVKMNAAVALKRIGDSSADAFLADLLTKPIAQVRETAAGAYLFSTAKGPQWDKAVREMQSDPDELRRLDAAEMLACCDVKAAKVTLTKALASPNPLLRQRAAQIFEARRDQLADTVIARTIVGDSLEAIRVYGDGMTLALAKK